MRRRVELGADVCYCLGSNASICVVNISYWLMYGNIELRVSLLGLRSLVTVITG